MSVGNDLPGQPALGETTLKFNENRLGNRLIWLARLGPLCLVLLLPLLGWSAYKALANASTDVLEWLPGDSEEALNLNWFDRHFGSDQVLVISWHGAVIGEQRVTDVESGIRRLQTAAGQRLFTRVVSGSDVMRYLTGPMAVDRNEALARMEGWLAGPGEATAIVAVISKKGIPELASAIQRVQSIAVDVTGLPADDIRMAGTTLDGVAVAAASKSQTFLLGALAVAAAVLIAGFAMGGLLNALPVLLSALTGMLASLSVMFWLGLPVDGLSVIVPVLGFVLTASATLHLDGYRRSVGTCPDQIEVDAVRTALMQGAWPTGIALLTTFAGFACLGFSGTLPIQRFAIASSLTVIIVALTTFLLWPGLAVALRRPEPELTERFSAGRLGAFVTAHSKLIFIIFLLLAMAAIGGLPRLDKGFGIDQLLRSDNPLIEDYRWFEENLGNVVPVEIVIKIKPSNADPNEAFLQRVELVGQARQVVQNIESVNGVFAADTFMPASALLDEETNEIRLQKKVTGLMRRAAGFALLSFEENGDELWRISARVSAFGGMDFNDLNKTIGTSVRETLQQNPDVKEVRVMGGLPLVAKAQQQLLRDLLLSFGVALFVLTVVFTWVFRSLLAGIVLLVPNILPVTLVFGFLGWLQSPIDIGLVMTASVALGLAVDDSSHLMIAFKRTLQKGRLTGIAVQSALQQVAPAAIRTSLLCGIPMLVFSASEFLPAARFGAVIGVLIFIALLVDLVLLPALLTQSNMKK